jgi:integrase
MGRFLSSPRHFVVMTEAASAPIEAEATPAAASIEESRKTLARLQRATENKGTTKHRDTVVRQFSSFLAGRAPSAALYLEFFTKDIEAKKPGSEERKYAVSTLWSRRSHLLKHFTIYMNPPLDVSSVDDTIYSALKGLSKSHVPNHAKMFLVTELFDFWARAPNEGEWLRDKAISLVGFYGLARNSELVDITWNDVREDERGVWILIHRVKCPADGALNEILIPRIKGRRVVPAELLLMYRDAVATRPHPRVWRKWNDRNKTWVLQPMGKNTIRLVPAKVAAFLHPGMPTTGYRGHSWRPSGATALGTYGGSVIQLKTAGHWCSDRVAESYNRDNSAARAEIAQKLSGPASQDETEGAAVDSAPQPTATTQPSIAPPASKIPKIVFNAPLHNCTITISMQP